MTTYTSFTPSNLQSPPFIMTSSLDGATHTISTLFNISGQRWYMQIEDMDNNIVWYGAMVGSPLNNDIPLAPGIFRTSTILYRADTGNIEVSP